MTAKILLNHEEDVEGLTLVPGDGGVFDVEVDGKLVYSKHKTGKFPEYDEIDKALA